jgi:integrase/recombinase XerD
VAAYRDAWRLLLRYAHDRTGRQPCQMDLADLDAPFIAGFLDHLEHDRGNTVRTRNARLAAIRSLFRYAALCHPEHAELRAKKITPHVLRHSCAMSLLAQGADTAVIALWMGHERVETTQIYVHADISIKERALARTAPPSTTPGRYHAPDSLLAFLTGL